MTGMLTDSEMLPAVPGAYALLIDLPRDLTPRLPRLGTLQLAHGRYLYVGSARGPGGIRARVRCHLRAGKSVRWHVDRLTNVAGVTMVAAVPDGDECRLFAAARAAADTVVPAPGFGSSDCARCPAHLLRLADGCDAEALLDALAGARGAVWHRPPAACFWRPAPRPPA
jgi:Uri superfamily endonuclease